MTTTQLERRAGVRCNGEALRQYMQFDHLQERFVSYRSKVEVAVDLLRDVARELHELETKVVQQKKNGYITSGVGSGVLGSALAAGLVTANPAVSVAMFAGTVLTSVGSLIVMTGRERKKTQELEDQVTRLLLDLEQEFEKCQSAMLAVEGDTRGMESVKASLEVARIGREMVGPGGRNLDTVASIINNISSFSRDIRDRFDSLPREVRGLLEDGFSQMQYFISPYGATTLIGMLKNESEQGGVLRNTTRGMSPDACCAGSAVDCLVTSSVTNNVTSDATSSNVSVSNVTKTTAVCEGSKKSFYASCGKLGKVVYTVGAVVAAFELYNSVSKAGQLTRQLRRLRDSADLLKYEGAAKEVFNISLDLQVILTTVLRSDGSE